MSTLKTNNIDSYSGGNVVIKKTIDLNGNNIAGVNTATITDLTAQNATTVKAGLLSGTDKSRLDALHSNALVDSDFTGTSGFLKKVGVNSYSLDENTYLTENETITISGDVGTLVTGVTGTTTFDLELNTDAIIGKSDTATISAINDRILIASYNAGNYTLKKVSPQNLGVASGGGFGAFDPARGIEQYAIVDDTVTLQANYKIIDIQDAFSSSDLQSADEMLWRDDSTQTLKKMSYSNLSTRLATDIGGGGGGGGYVIGGIVDMSVSSNMELIMDHTGAFDNTNAYINSNNEFVLES